MNMLRRFGGHRAVIGVINTSRSGEFANVRRVFATWDALTEQQQQFEIGKQD